VRELRHRRAQGFEQHHVLGRVRDVVVASHHVCNPHLHIVRDDRQVVGGLPIRAQDDEVLDVRAVEGNRPVHEIRKTRVAFRNAKANRGCSSRGLVVRYLLRCEREAAAVVEPTAACGFGSLPLLLQPVR
jgi:hypothetical protein